MAGALTTLSVKDGVGNVAADAGLGRERDRARTVHLYPHANGYW